MRDKPGPAADAESIQEDLWTAVRGIPVGKVATYGDVADFTSTVKLTARQVGRLMSLCPEGVPWHRVVGAGGMLPIGKLSPAAEAEQRARLTADGVRFLGSGRIDMTSHRCGPGDLPGPLEE
ncbi:MAG: MGMT family protein [Armatimonadetes bacterium]|nr:MGMT family protein [Armatimonadota bacterium]